MWRKIEGPEILLGGIAIAGILMVILSAGKVVSAPTPPPRCWEVDLRIQYGIGAQAFIKGTICERP